MTAAPTRPKWVMYAAIAAGAMLGGITYSISYSLVSDAVRPAPRPVAEQSRPDAKDGAPPTTLVHVPTPTPSPAPDPQSSGSEAQHREAIHALIRAYNQVADGYARIRDADSIPRGQGSIDRAVEQLRTAAQRGRRLPQLSPVEREALIRWGAPPLLGAIDRVLGELRRLKETPGLRSDFDRLIDSYTRAREEVRRVLEQP